MIGRKRETEILQPLEKANKFASYNRYQIIQLYMALEGIPFYLEMIDPAKSTIQNINDLCFTLRGMLRREYNNLYPSLFKMLADTKRLSKH